MIMKLTVLALTIGVLTASCASVKHGTMQRIPVQTEPAGARVGIDCGDAPRRAGELTPTVITVPRKADTCRLRLTKPGYEPEIVELRRVTSPAVYGNLNAAGAGVEVLVDSICCDDVAAAVGAFTLVTGAVVGGFGFAVDHATGAMYQHIPTHVAVELTPLIDDSLEEEQDDPTGEGDDTAARR